MKRRWFLAGATIVLLLAHPFSMVVHADPYTVEDLGSLGGDSFARGVNSAGTAVGYSQLADASTRGFVEPGGGLLPMPTFGGADSRGHGINSAGLVAGYAQLASGAPRAVRYAPATDTLTDLGTLGGDESYAYGINAAGAIVGYSLDGSGLPIAFMWTEAGGMQPLGTLAGGIASFAYGVNNAGQAVGESFTAAGQVHAFLYSAGAMQDLGTLGGMSSLATAVNDAGVVSGGARLASGAQHAFRYSAATGMVDLGTLGGATSMGEGIAPDGTVLGWSTDALGRTRATLWTPAGDMVDLNTLIDPASGWALLAAHGMNEAGQIVGHGTHNGVVRAFRLTPPSSGGGGTAPVITAVTATPGVLWPANHNLVRVDVTVVASDDSGETPVCRISNVYSNEPDNGQGDGDTPVDVVAGGALDVRLRAERSAHGEGRVYTIEVTCSDSSGNETTGVATVSVPKNVPSDSTNTRRKRYQP